MDIDSFPGTRSPGIVAAFTYDVVHDRWEWSDDLYRMHGYAPGEIPATTSALLAHKHKDDRDRAAGVFADVIRDGGTYKCYHRVVDRNQRVLSVVSVGSTALDEQGRPATVEGYYIDLTEARRDETEVDVQEALAQKAPAAPVIEQAKGMLMLAERCSEDEAFARVRAASEHANRKVADIARDLVAAVSKGGAGNETVTDALGRLVAEARGESTDATGARSSA